MNGRSLEPNRRQQRTYLPLDSPLTSTLPEHRQECRARTRNIGDLPRARPPTLQHSPTFWPHHRERRRVPVLRNERVCVSQHELGAVRQPAYLPVLEHDDDDDDDRLDDTLKPKPKRRRRRRTPFNVDSTEGCNCSVVPSVNVIQAPDLCDSRLLKPLRTLDSVSTRFTHRRWRHAHQLVVLAHCGEAGEPRGKRHGWEPTCDVEKLRPSQVVLVDFACRS